MTNKKTYECVNGCGYTHTHRGAMNIHEKVHCSKIRTRFNLEELAFDECEHEWRFLNPDNQVELKAIQNKYMEVCEKCQELKK